MLAIVIAILCLGGVLNKYIPTRFQHDYRFNLPKLIHYQLLSGNNAVSMNWQALSYGASRERYSYFHQGNVNFQVYLADYAQQSQGKEMIFVDNRLFNPQRWRQLSLRSLPLTANSILSQVKLLNLRRSNDRARSIAYWYVIDGQYTADNNLAKLLGLKATLAGRPGSTLIAVAIDYDISEQAIAKIALSKFTAALTPR